MKNVKMATLYTEQSKNVTKTLMLMSAFFVIIILFGWFFSSYFGNPNLLYFFVIFSVLMNFFSYWFSDKIVLKLAGAKEAKREEYFNLYTSVENLSITAGLPSPKGDVVGSPDPNAFATGRDKNHAVVCATTGLLKILEKTELEGVIAHELSHIGNKDMLLSTVIVIFAGIIALLSDFFLRMSFWGGRRDNDDNRAGALLMLLGILASILAPIAATLIKLAISRKREFLADADGALLTRYPEGLASALEKIDADVTPMRKAAHPATAHPFIDSPFNDRQHQNWFVKIFSTHPPVEERIKALRDMQV